MPFIWDNFEWMLVNDEDPYDKSRFVVARKILVKPVQLNVVCIQSFLLENICMDLIRNFSSNSSMKFFRLNQFVDIFEDLARSNRSKYCPTMKHM